MEAVIPDRDNEAAPKEDDRKAYRERPIIERIINRLQRDRRIATRYMMLAATYLTMVTIVCVLEWLSRCGQTPKRLTLRTQTVL